MSLPGLKHCMVWFIFCFSQRLRENIRKSAHGYLQNLPVFPPYGLNLYPYYFTIISVRHQHNYILMIIIPSRESPKMGWYWESQENMTSRKGKTIRILNIQSLSSCRGLRKSWGVVKIGREVHSRVLYLEFNHCTTTLHFIKLTVHRKSRFPYLLFYK